ncbi:MAG: carboxypeptidase-like regulatory domain-containing protein [Planctomycetes bacterium]|nr:carboxypeptidase-like regulatory domain-containing protein [Planctomycetota bacterium]
MTARRFLLPAAALLALAAGLLAFLPKGVPRTKDRPAAGSALPGGAGAEEPGAPVSPSSDSEQARNSPESGPSSGVREEIDLGVDPGRVEGRLLLPEGEVLSKVRVALVKENPTPDSRDMFSVAMRAAFEDPTSWSRPPSELLENAKTDRSGPSAEVSGDGSFSIAVPRASKEYWALVESDFLYQERAPRVRTDGSGNARGVEVPVLLGGRLAGTVRSKDGAPVGAAKVELAPAFDPLSMFSGDRPELSPREAETDGKGEWSIGGVRAGKNLVLSSSAEGHGPAMRTGIEIVPGREVRIDLVLPAEGAIAGRVTDESDRPVAEAEVKAAPGGDFRTLLALREGKAKTAADGKYRIGGLASGEYRVTAEKVGWKKSKTAKVRVEEGKTTPAEASVLPEGNTISGRVLDPKGAPARGIDVRARFEPNAFTMADPAVLSGGTRSRARTGEDGSFRITGLGAGPFKVSARAEDEASAIATGVKPGTKDLELRLRPCGGVAGIVVDGKTEEPIPSFRIETRETAFGMLEVKGKEREFRSEDGAFKWSGLDPGTYLFRAEAPGHAPAKIENVAVREGATTPGVVIRLQPQAVVRGRVIAAGDRSPVERAVVTTAMQGAFAIFQSMTGERNEARTDAKGEFRLEGLPSGEVALSAKHRDFADGRSAPLRLEAGATVEDVEIVLTAGGGVDGFVYGEGGAPVQGCMVMVSTPTASVMRSTETDEKGYFLVKALSPGSYQVTSMSMRFDGAVDPESMSQLMEGMRATSAEVEEGRITHVVLGEEEGGGVRVHGRVLSGERPVGGAILTALPAGQGKELRMRNAVSREDGSYSIDGVRPGRNIINVQRIDAGTGAFTLIEVPVEVPEGTDFAHDLLLSVASISGRVTDARTGDPLEEIRVSLQREDREQEGMLGGGLSEAQTNSEGGYRFEGVKPGRYTVAAGGPTIFGSDPKGFGRAIRSGLAIGEATEMKGIDFALRPGGTILGTVRDSANHPVEGASLFFRDEDGAVVNRMSEIFTDGGGGFRAPGLASGTYRVLARAPGSGIGSLDGVVVTAGQERRVSVVLAPGTELTARVADAEGKPVAGAQAALFDASGEAVSGLQGISDFVEFFRKGAPGLGEVRVGAYPPGSYRLRVTATGFKPREVSLSLGGEPEKSVDVRVERD